MGTLYHGNRPGAFMAGGEAHPDVVHNGNFSANVTVTGTTEMLDTAKLGVVGSGNFASHAGLIIGCDGTGGVSPVSVESIDELEVDCLVA